MRGSIVLALAAAAGCAGRTRTEDETPRVPSAAQQALECATGVARAGAFASARAIRVRRWWSSPSAGVGATG